MIFLNSDYGGWTTCIIMEHKKNKKEEKQFQTANHEGISWIICCTVFYCFNISKLQRQPTIDGSTQKHKCLNSML